MKIAFKVELTDEEEAVKALENDRYKTQKRTRLPGRKFRRNLPAGRKLLETYGRGLQADSC